MMVIVHNLRTGASKKTPILRPDLEVHVSNPERNNVIKMTTPSKWACNKRRRPRNEVITPITSISSGNGVNNKLYDDEEENYSSYCLEGPSLGSMEGDYDSGSGEEDLCRVTGSSEVGAIDKNGSFLDEVTIRSMKLPDLKVALNSINLSILGKKEDLVGSLLSANSLCGGLSE